MTKAVAILAVSVLAVSALAQDTDEICIVFAGGDNCLSVPALTPFTFYVVLQNASASSGVSGYELCLCNADGAPLTAPYGYFIGSYSIPAGGTNLIVPPCFLGSFNIELPWTQSRVLLEAHCWCINPVPWCFGLRPATNAIIPGQMSYLAGGDSGDWRIMHSCVGPSGDSCFMACVNDPNCPPPVSAVEATWGAIKGIYR